MGSLIPGATYIYERADGVTYAREFGSNPSTRRAIGWDYNYRKDPILNSGQIDLENHKLWNEIRLAAKTNPALQKAVDNVIILYRLTKNDPI